VYSGKLQTSSVLLNANKNVKERIMKLYKVYANEFEPVDEISAGNIGVICGTKFTSTGDTLTCLTEKLKLQGIYFPPAVFSCSVEPTTLSDESALEEALGIVKMEDPSIKVEKNLESGQIVICGMGELHLEIIKHRITNDLKAKAFFGNVQISFRESILQAATKGESIEREIKGKKYKAFISISIERIDSLQNEIIVPREILEKAQSVLEDSDLVENIANESISAALSCGPLSGSPIHQARVMIKSIDSSLLNSSFLQSAFYDMTRKLIRQVPTVVMEPLAELNIEVDERYLGAVLSDLTCKRKADIGNVENGISGSRITAYAPMSALIGYSTDLRSITSGNASFSMVTSNYKEIEK
jgi:elongation factor G